MHCSVASGYSYRPIDRHSSVTRRIRRHAGFLFPSFLFHFSELGALLDPTLPTTSRVHTPSKSTCKKYARAVSALLACLSGSRTVARSNLWALRHILVLAFYAKKYLQVEDVHGGLAAFGIAKEHLEDIVEKVKSLTTYLLGHVEDSMHAKVVNGLMSKDGAVVVEDDSLASFVGALVRRAKEKDRVRDTSVLGIVLQHLFTDATRDDANLWLTLARMLEKSGQIVYSFPPRYSLMHIPTSSAPQTTITILASITAFAPEPPKLDRYRNELAASLVGIRPGAASTAGLVTLRLLAATAPDLESDIVFLPQ